TDTLYAVGVGSGSRPMALTGGGIGAVRAAGWTRDGRVLWFNQMTAGRKDSGIFVSAAEAREAPTQVLAGETIIEARLSPDETRIAFTSLRTGRSEVYVETFPQPSEYPQPISRSGGRSPRWRGDGRELYFVAGDDELMTVAVPSASQVPFG